MIVNITGTKTNGQFVFDSPPLRLEDQSSFKIRLLHLHYKFAETESNGQIDHNELLALTTNLVDRSFTNISQSIHNFCFDGNSTWQNVRQEDPLFYPLVLHELDNATFQIVSLYEDRTLELEKIFIQIKIETQITHGWF